MHVSYTFYTRTKHKHIVSFPCKYFPMFTFSLDVVLYYFSLGIVCCAGKCHQALMSIGLFVQQWGFHRV